MLSGRSEFIWANICEILVDLYLSYYCVSFNHHGEFDQTSTNQELDGWN